MINKTLEIRVYDEFVVGDNSISKNLKSTEKSKPLFYFVFVFKQVFTAMKGLANSPNSLISVFKNVDLNFESRFLIAL